MTILICHRLLLLHQRILCPRRACPLPKIVLLLWPAHMQPLICIKGHHQLHRQMPHRSEPERVDVCIAALCGLPGAGKTTLCKGLLQTARHHLEIQHICFDESLSAALSDHQKSNDDAASIWKVLAVHFFSCVQACFVQIRGKETGHGLTVLDSWDRHPERMCFESSKMY